MDTSKPAPEKTLGGSLSRAAAGTAAALLFVTLTFAGAGTLVAYLIISLHNAPDHFAVATPLL